MSDFTRGKLWKGLLIALINGLIFIAIPLFLKTYDIKFSGISVQVSQDFVNKWLYCGIPITIISFFTGFYEKGNIFKVYATAIQVVIVIISLFVIFSTNVDDILTIHYGGTTITVGLAIAGMLVMISVSKILKFLITIVDYYDYKKEFQEDVRKRERKNKLLDKIGLIEKEKKD